MWMMGCSDAGDSFSSGRKLRTLVPRPPVPAAAVNPPCLGRVHGAADLLSFNHHLAAMTEQSKRDFNAQQQQVVVTSRWNPTPEQLQTLEELYRRGTRTPSADQIQHITAQLRRYGKIEGKNVFYWFQNHKARERQKRRRQLESASSDDPATQVVEKSGVNETGLEVAGTKNWASPTINCSILPEKAVSIRREQKATNPDRRSDGWEQFNDHTEPISPPHMNKSLEQEHEHQHEEERNATWHMMQSFVTSSSSSSSSSTSSTCPTTKFISSDPTAEIRTTKVHRKPFVDNSHNYQNLGSIFKTPYYNTEKARSGFTRVKGVHEANCDSRSQTLELFPLRSTSNFESENAVVAAAAAAEKERVAPHKFFEFLPIKNS